MRHARLVFAFNGDPRGVSSGGKNEPTPVAYAQECDLLVPNDEGVGTYRTLRGNDRLDRDRRLAIERDANALGGRVIWRTSPRAGRTYGLLECERTFDGADFDGVTVYDVPVIALAVFPAVVEALPNLVEALGGPGRLAGIRSCDRSGQGVVVEWDLERTAATLVLGAVDVELRRFNSGRTAELLTPLPLPWVARLASDALCAPEIGEDRVLEALVARAGGHE